MWCVHSKRNTSLQWEKILHFSGKKSSKKIRKTERGKRRNKSADKLLKPPNKEEKWAHEKQNRVNGEKDSDTHRQETEEATGKGKVSEEAIRKRRTQDEIAIKPKIAEDKEIW